MLELHWQNGPVSLRVQLDATMVWVLLRVTFLVIEYLSKLQNIGLN